MLSYNMLSAHLVRHFALSHPRSQPARDAVAASCVHYMLPNRMIQSPPQNDHQSTRWGSMGIWQQNMHYPYIRVASASIHCELPFLSIVSLREHQTVFDARLVRVHFTLFSIKCDFAAISHYWVKVILFLFDRIYCVQVCPGVCYVRYNSSTSEITPFAIHTIFADVLLNVAIAHFLINCTRRTNQLTLYTAAFHIHMSIYIYVYIMIEENAWVRSAVFKFKGRRSTIARADHIATPKKEAAVNKKKKTNTLRALEAPLYNKYNTHIQSERTYA